MASASRSAPSWNERLSALAGLLIAVAPAMYLLHVIQVPRRIVIGFGILCWAAGVMVKWAAYQLVIVKRLHPQWPPGRLAVAQGVLSSVSELGAAVLFFAFMPKLTVLGAIGMGTGAAFVEGVLTTTINLSQGTPYGGHVAEQELLAKQQGALVTPILCISDRLLATVVQICSRTLVFLSIRSGNPLPAAVAFATFAAIDGLAYYALVKKWEFGRLTVAAKLYGMLAGVAIVQGAALLLAMT